MAVSREGETAVNRLIKIANVQVLFSVLSVHVFVVEPHITHIPYRMVKTCAIVRPLYTEKQSVIITRYVLR